MYEAGDTYTNAITVKDATGTLVDAGSVSVLVTLPDQSTASPSVLHPSTGNYSFNYVTTQVGQHTFTWTATGSNAFVQSDVFNVAAPAFVISLDQARKGLGLAAANTVNDEDLRLFIQAATPIMEDLIGSIVARTRIESYDGGRPQIGLLWAPVMSITSIIESYGSNYVRTLTAQDIFSGSGSGDAFAYTVDLTTGIITRRASGVAINFVSGTRNVQVTYVTGRVLAGNHLLAARRLIRHLYQTEQQGFRPQMGSPETTLGSTPSGYAVPRAVIELCADSSRPPGIG